MRGPPCGVARFPLPTVRETAVCGATFHIVTLGCRSNQYDSQRIAEALQAAGLRAAADGEPAQVYVVNTCTVTAVADSKARQLVRRIVREHPAARVFVTGCYATREPEALRRIGGVEGVFGRGEWGQMLHAICGAPPPEGVLEGDFGISGFHGRARALFRRAATSAAPTASCRLCAAGPAAGPFRTCWKKRAGCWMRVSRR